MTSRDYRDIIGGMLMTGLGLFIVYYTQRYEIGTVSDMGPGYFPLGLGVLLSIFGLMVAVPGFFRSGAPIHVNWRGYVFVIGSLLFFALALRAFGLILTTAVAVGISSLASPVPTAKKRVILVLAVVAVTYVIFILGLNMRIPIWPRAL